MEKKVAHYSLESIKTLINDNKYRVTSSARVTYTQLGLDDEEALSIIKSLRPKDLYKSMTSHHDNTIWQDVYHSKYQIIDLYIKLQINEDAIIISFKEL